MTKVTGATARDHLASLQPALIVLALVLCANCGTMRQSTRGESESENSALVPVPRFVDAIPGPPRDMLDANDPLVTLAQSGEVTCGLSRAGVVRCARLHGNEVSGPWHPGPLRAAVEAFETGGQYLCLRLRSGERWCLQNHDFDDSDERTFWSQTIPLLLPSTEVPRSGAMAPRCRVESARACCRGERGCTPVLLSGDVLSVAETSRQNACAIHGTDRLVSCWSGASEPIAMPFAGATTLRAIDNFEFHVATATAVYSVARQGDWVSRLLRRIDRPIAPMTASCGLDGEGAAVCWGEAYQAMETVLNDARAPSWWSTPDASSLAARPVVSLSPRGGLCGVLDTGQVLCWQGGRNVSLVNSQPILLPEITRARSVRSGGNDFSPLSIASGCALTAEHTLQCWGLSWTAQRGDFVPLPLPSSELVSDWMLTGDSPAVLFANGDVYVWNGTAWRQVTIANARYLADRCAASANELVCWRQQPEYHQSALALDPPISGVSTDIVGGSMSVRLCRGDTAYQLNTPSCFDGPIRDFLHPERWDARCHPLRPEPAGQCVDAGGVVVTAGRATWHEPVLRYDGEDHDFVPSSTILGAVWSIHEHGHLCWTGPHGLFCRTESTSDRWPYPLPDRWGWVSGLDHIAELAHGDGHVCARSESGSVWCWGSNALGQSGIAPAFVDRPNLVVETGARALAAVANTSCAWMQSGTVECWGGWTRDSGRRSQTSVGYSTPRAVDGLLGDLTELVGSCVRSQSRGWLCWSAFGEYELETELACPSPFCATVAREAAPDPSNAPNASWCELAQGRVRCRVSREYSLLGPVAMIR